MIPFHLPNCLAEQHRLQLLHVVNKREKLLAGGWAEMKREGQSHEGAVTDLMLYGSDLPAF